MNKNSVGRGFTKEGALIGEIMVFLGLRNGGGHDHQYYEANSCYYPCINGAFPHFSRRVSGSEKRETRGLETVAVSDRHVRGGRKEERKPVRAVRWRLPVEWAQHFLRYMPQRYNMRPICFCTRWAQQPFKRNCAFHGKC